VSAKDVRTVRFLDSPFLYDSHLLFLESGMLVCVMNSNYQFDLLRVNMYFLLGGISLIS